MDLFHVLLVICSLAGGPNSQYECVFPEHDAISMSHKTPEQCAEAYTRLLRVVRESPQGQEIFAKDRTKMTGGCVQAPADWSFEKLPIDKQIEVILKLNGGIRG